MEAAEESDDEDLVPPPMSFSLPELFSADHQVVEIFREAVSSTELLHERAMERFYRAVEAEKNAAQQSRANGQSADARAANQRTEYPLFNARSRPVRRRLSNSGGSATTWQLRRDRRRSSEGQAKVTELRAPEGLLQSASSDPNLLTSDEMLVPKKAEPWPAIGGGGLADSTERLRRWHEPGIDLSNEESIADMIDKENLHNKQREELLKLPELHIRVLFIIGFSVCL